MSRNIAATEGRSYIDVPSVIAGKRQEVRIPPIKARYVEHVEHRKTRARCGKKSVGPFPALIKGPIRYSGHITALVAYLTGYQYMPYRRTRVLPKDLFGISLSEGTVDNMLKSAARQSLFVYGTIQERPQKEGGGDEAGARIEGGKGWFHVWQSAAMTFIAASMDRGFKTVPRYFPNGFPTAD